MWVPAQNNSKRCDLQNKSLTIYRLGIHCLPGNCLATVPPVADITQSESAQSIKLSLPLRVHACTRSTGHHESFAVTLLLGDWVSCWACKPGSKQTSDSAPTLIALVHVAFYMGAGDLNSGPREWKASVLTHWATSPAPCSLFPPLMTTSHTISPKYST